MINEHFPFDAQGGQQTMSRIESNSALFIQWLDTEWNHAMQPCWRVDTSNHRHLGIGYIVDDGQEWRFMPSPYVNKFSCKELTGIAEVICRLEANRKGPVG
ncbi:MAG: hypothetical protein ACR2QC_12000 [Gammaproteobacteria bacterium]